MQITKNKVYIFLIGLMVILGIFIAYLKMDSPKIELQEMHADTIYVVESMEDAENFSDAIVKAKVLPNSENIPHEVGVMMGRTYTDIEILEVYAGNLSPGDIVKITEEYYYEKIESQETLIYFDNYLPSKTNGEYIFFLGISNYENTKNDYFVIGGAMGRYPCDEVFNVTELDKSVYRINSPLTENSLYDKVKKEVLEKYN